MTKHFKCYIIALKITNKLMCLHAEAVLKWLSKYTTNTQTHLLCTDDA